METYKLHVAGLERDLPICPLNDNLSIAGFVMFGDVEMTIRSAEELLKRVGDFDLLITAESKGIPLAYEMSRQSGKKYILARKSIKLYMHDPVSVSVKSITTAQVQTWIAPIWSRSAASASSSWTMLYPLVSRCTLWSAWWRSPAV